MHEITVSPEATRQVLRDYWRQYKTSPLDTILGFFLPAIGSVFVFFVPPLYIAKLVNLIASGQGVSLTNGGVDVALFTGSWLLGELFWRIGMHFFNKVETAGLNVLGKESFRRLSERDYDFYTDNFVGSLTKKTISFMKGFETFTDTLVFNVVINLFPMLFALVVLGRYSLWLPTILVVSIGIVIAIGIPIIRKRSKLVTLRHMASSKVAADISDVMTNISTVKAFAREEQEQQTFDGDVNDFTQKYLHAANFQNLRFDTVMSPMYVTTNAIGLIAAIGFTQQLGLQVGTMVIVFSYYSQITRFFWEINRIYRNMESAISEASEFTQLVLAPAAIRDVPHAGTLQLSNVDISFHGVNFKYKNTSESPLFFSNFNLDIKGGQRVGLVGPSGGGKTTITKLLLRFAEVESGAVTIDGQDIRQISQRSLREAIGYVPQEPLLFHRSLFDNIAYGNTGATEAAVIRASELAHAHEFIKDLPRGYQTMVGERGIKLSGGQRQRVAIARAILKNAPILILDEATSSLDSESEKYIQEGLWELMKDKTAVVIAHRLSTIKHLDRIVVLEEGSISEDGTHDELVKKEGTYAKLWGHQSGGFLEEESSVI